MRLYVARGEPVLKVKTTVGHARKLRETLDITRRKVERGHPVLVNPIYQRGAHDCAVAVLAMLLGKTYEEAAAVISVKEDALGRMGFNEAPFKRLLSSLTNRLEQRSRYPLDLSATPADFPPMPFAPVHYAIVDMNLKWPDRMLADRSFRDLVNANARKAGI